MTDLLITNARLVDPEGDAIRPGALLVRNGVIAEIFDTPDSRGQP